MTKISNKINWNGREITLTWIPDPNLKKYKPIIQAYGICFDKEGKILVIKDKKWQIPGGTVEPGETLEQTLKRELIEEAWVEIKDIKPLGVQEVSFPDNPNKKEGDLYYQCRFVASVTKINPIRPDPATGKTYKREFFPADEINNYLSWGKSGEEMFKDARVLYQKSRA